MDTKRLMVKLNQISSQYIGKIMYALFFMSILEMMSVFAIALLFRGESQLLSPFVSFVTLFVVISFQFGFSVMLLQMSRRKNTNLGYLFMGFTKLNPAGKITASLALFMAIVGLLSGFLGRIAFSLFDLHFLSEKLALSLGEATKNAPISLHAQDFDSLVVMAIASLIFFVLSFVIFIRFVLIFPLHFDNPALGVQAVFKKSANLMHKNVFRLIIFALRAGGKRLLIAFALLFASIVIPERENASISILLFFIEMAYIINLYTAVARIYLTVPILYEELTNPSEEIENGTLNIENS